jgi:apolipoprotein N-acyltransferase
VYGVSGLVALGNGVVAELIHATRARGIRAVHLRGALAAAAVFALLLGASLGYGAARRDALPADPTGLRVAVVQANEAPDLRWRSATAHRVFGTYAELTRGALEAETAGGRPDLVVWPENALQLSPRDPSVALALDGLATDVPLLLGAPRYDERGHAYNSAWLLLGGGRSEVYDKRRLLPFAETRPFGSGLRARREGDLAVGSFAGGSTPGLLGLGREKLGVLICLEALYPALPRELARAGATVLVNLSNEGWFRGRGGAEQHLAPAVFRAVETRLPLVRSTTTGVSAVIDPSGRQLAALGRGRAGVLREALARGAASPTPYVRFGDAFALACVGLWIAAIAAASGGKRASSAR